MLDELDTINQIAVFVTVTAERAVELLAVNAPTVTLYDPGPAAIIGGGDGIVFVGLNTTSVTIADACNA